MPGLSGRCDALLSYESERFILIKNWKLALTFRLIQVGIIIYIIVYQIVLKQGYQELDQLIGTASTKVKGTATTGTLGSANYQVYDVYDLIPNPLEKDALYISTNYFATQGQTKSVCAGNDKTESCSNLAPCQPGTLTLNGVIANPPTCNIPANQTKGYCNILSWCPLEVDNKNPVANIMNGVGNWTIYLKVNVEYPHFQQQLSNTFPNSLLVPALNLFSVEDLLHFVNSTTSYASVSQFGAIILVQVLLDCDFNVGGCDPEFSAFRLDQQAPGFNYRYIINAPGSLTGGTRDLVKSFGIRFIFDVSGTGKRFSIVPLLVAIGSGVGLLSVATLVCDFVLQKFLPDKDRYLAEKYQHVAEQGIPEFSAGDVLAINELANTRHLAMGPTGAGDRQNQSGQAYQGIHNNGQNSNLADSKNYDYRSI